MQEQAKKLEKLRQIIQASGKSQKELAAAAGITEVTLSRWVQGKREPREQEFARLAKVLGVPLSEFNELTSKEPTPEEWKQRALTAEAALAKIREGQHVDVDLNGMDAEEYLARLRESMRFVFNFITHD